MDIFLYHRSERLSWAFSYVWLASFDERWVGIAVRARSTKVLRAHGGLLQTLATMNYSTR
jgi:hypothetical protein